MIMVKGKVKRYCFEYNRLSTLYYGQKGSVFLMLKVRRPTSSVSVINRVTTGIEPYRNNR